ncbi:methyl-accepting chemotaxis protein [Trichlorobacter lovleyi]|jgi:methyl-accepting chemotaxis protein|uniref:Methyl-accepting chemotaxis sensory transducer n=1 Tax=Trichlorobacter lovleyi (strain ATCC BAA-1151 / DSM 17278 / SZ) TaxID=398767 RepID=B3E824_TRIL1|nr:methyl-accepting chemotaxis protein [Trichlorobacter lovleyi]ACD96597.1 methyl-accepting chemotaxis sensory transducer [Trichlorobacter lovleyi SZ]
MADLTSGSSIIRFLLFAGTGIALFGAGATFVLLSEPASDTSIMLTKFVLAGFVACASIFATVIKVMASRGLVRRVAELTTAICQGTEGNLTVQVAVASDDELGHLGKTVNSLFNKFGKMVLQINDTISELGKISDQNNEAASHVLTTVRSQSEEAAVGSAAVAGIDASVVLVRKSVEQMTVSAQENSACISELTANIDEVRQHAETQSASIEDVSSAMVEMSTLMEQVGKNVGSLMDAASTTTSSVEEIDLLIQQVGGTVHNTAAAAEGVRLDAELGQQVVLSAISCINGIVHSSKSAYDSITTLSQRVSAIGKIISVIDDIADQTNLLALNSAILAAQAGEHGKGFAIVANEIKGLAKRTRQSTMEIALLIKGVQEETGKAVTAIRITEERVADGENLSRRSGEALSKIVSGVEAAGRQIIDIAHSTEEQARRSSNMHKSIRTMTNMVAHIFRSSQELIQASRSITKAAERTREFTALVQTSSVRQWQMSTTIATSTANMEDKTRGIKEACGEQSEWSVQINQSMERITQTADINLASVRILENGAENLAGQIQVLRNEMAHLRAE